MPGRGQFAAFLLVALFVAGCGSGSSGAPPEEGPGGPIPGPGPGPTPGPGEFRDGFESGLGLWTKDADVPLSPGNPTVPVAWFIEASQEQATEGSTSARFILDGSGDDGTTWLERAFSVTPSTDYTVHITAAWWSGAESFNITAMVAAYAGSTSPEQELDFLITDPLNLVGGWRTYSATFDVTSAADGALHVGIGLSVVWETWITYYLDDVRVTITPRD